MKRMKTVDWIDYFLPCSRWIRTYNWREYLQPDVIAGVTVGVMLVPQVETELKLLMYKTETDRLISFLLLPVADFCSRV